MPTDPAMPQRDAAALARRLQALEDRISKLERLPKLPSSSMQGGSLTLLDDNGNVRWVAGNISFSTAVIAPDGNATITNGYGVAEFDDQGAVLSVQIAGIRGRAWPSVPFPMHDPTPKSTTSSTFTNMFEGREQNPIHDAFKVFAAVQTDSGTTGELRLNTGTHQTSVLTLPSATNAFATFTWEHPAVVGLGDDRAGREGNLYIALEARRTSGTGSVRVFPPQFAEMVSSFVVPNAATNGNPTLG